MAGGAGDHAVWNAVEWLLTGLATFMVAMRVASRCSPAAQRNVLGGGWAANNLSGRWYFHADDIVMFIAWTFDVVSAALISVAISKGAGTVESTSQSKAWQSEAIRWTNIAVGFPQDGIAFANLSVALLLVRLFVKRSATNKQLIRWLLPSLSVISIILAALSQIFLFVQCTPVAFGWDKNIPGGKCWAPSVLTDFVIFMKVFTCAITLLYALYPIVIISKLNITLSRKIGLCCLLSAGLFVFASGIFASTLMHIDAYDQDVYIKNASAIMFWDKLHCDTIIIFGCVPAIGPAARTMKRTLQNIKLPRFSKEADSLTLRTEGSSRVKEKISAQSTVAKLEPDTYEGIPLAGSKCKGKFSSLLYKPLSRLKSLESPDHIDDLALRCPQPVHIRQHIEVYETETDDTAAPVQPWMDPRWYQ